MASSKKTLNLLENKRLLVRTNDDAIRFIEQAVSRLKRGEYSGYIAFFHKTDGSMDYTSSGDFDLFKQIGAFEDWKHEMFKRR